MFSSCFLFSLIGRNEPPLKPHEGENNCLNSDSQHNLWLWTHRLKPHPSDMCHLCCAETHHGTNFSVTLWFTWEVRVIRPAQNQGSGARREGRRHRWADQSGEGIKIESYISEVRPASPHNTKPEGDETRRLPLFTTLTPHHHCHPYHHHHHHHHHNGSDNYIRFWACWK